jgi:hypothetical protein
MERRIRTKLPVRCQHCSEREGGGNGRVYTIAFKVRDASNNEATATAVVNGTKTQNLVAAVEDEPNYVVLSSCPGLRRGVITD